jgi:hypothetical protein
LLRGFLRFDRIVIEKGLQNKLQPFYILWLPDLDLNQGPAD